MQKTRMTPGSLAAQFLRLTSSWRAVSLRASREVSIAAIAVVGFEEWRRVPRWWISFGDGRRDEGFEGAAEEEGASGGEEMGDEAKPEFPKSREQCGIHG